jgi:hypothetical protein
MEIKNSELEEILEKGVYICNLGQNIHLTSLRYKGKKTEEKEKMEILIWSMEILQKKINELIRKDKKNENALKVKEILAKMKKSFELQIDYYKSGKEETKIEASNELHEIGDMIYKIVNELKNG